MNLVDNYIESSTNRELLVRLRSLVLGHSLLKEEFKWSMPVYTKNGKDVCYIKATKNGANIGFTKGSLLAENASLLEGSGKEMRHIKIPNLEALDKVSTDIKSLVEQALKLE